MKLKSILLAFALLFLPIGTVAKEIKCDNKSTCMKDKNLYVTVKRVVQRGKVLIIQLNFYALQYMDIDFTDGKRGEGAILLDADGKEFKISGEKISNMYLDRGTNKVLSLRFKGDIKAPFDLTIKTKRKEFTLFDLKPEGQAKNSDGNK